ncbi:uncharacterized protein C8R40DRAFT_1112985 [Lentinula edodes]|uniref:uncharacterized protein n=1 Tax=Lentinula edodes TaxID=5353 RepID=UPI001E8E2754|nr:uncharacterized protein C8R40DRAFT_1112985 [Lentinula edodes]KAH7873654.1 hypothetical protein C8R40DRAFT_1112985 [Lentinula edodes]
MLFQNFLHSFMRVFLCLCLPLATSTVKAIPTGSLLKNQKELSSRAHSVHDEAKRPSSFKSSSQPITLYLPTTAPNAENLVNKGGNLKEVYQEPFGNYRRLFTTLPELDEKSGDYAVVEFLLSPAKGIRIVDARKKSFLNAFGWPKFLQDVTKGRLPGVIPGSKPDVYFAGSVALLYGDKVAEPPVLTYVTHETGKTFKEAWVKLQNGKQKRKKTKE